MREADFLFTISEVAVAFAGFATLVVVLSQRFSGVREEIEWIRLDSMLRCSLLAAFGALFPYRPSHAGLPEEATWRVSALALGAGWLAYFIYRFRSLRRAGAGTARMQRLSNWIAMVVIHPIGIAASLCLALGLLSGYAGSVYLASVLCLLGLAANLFVQLVASLSRRPAA